MDPAEIARRLTALFDPAEVKWKPQSVKGNRALAIAYIDARLIMDRLDEVVGVDGWQDQYQLLPDNSVMCVLRVRFGERWVRKVDVGSPSEQPDGGDRLKAAFSDALKRAAVKFGIGRYLYRLPQQWADYDPQKRQFSSPPRLPDWAVAKGAAPASAAARANGKPKPALPADGAELRQRLGEADAELARGGLIQAGQLVEHVREQGKKAGYSADIRKWQGPAIGLAVAEARAFKGRLQQPQPGGPGQ